MRVEILHASKFGNGAKVAEELGRLMEAKGAEVIVHHIKEVKAKALPAADLYVFGTPGRVGKPIGSMRRFLKKAALPAGARYAVFATEPTPRPDKKTGKVPTEEEIGKYNHVLSTMDELLQAKGAVKVAEAKVHVKGLKGPLEDDWQQEAGEFASRIDAGTRS
jgi:menaquinone-dependent protoporphyrinogen IX oxidase